MELCVPPGEKLDYKACESLEEVFKRVQFKVVDLEQTSLDEDVRLSTPLTLLPPLLPSRVSPPLLLSSIFFNFLPSFLSSTPFPRSHYFPPLISLSSRPPRLFSCPSLL